MSDYGGTWLLGLGITIVFAASMGHIDGSVQVCGLQIANDLVNTDEAAAVGQAADPGRQDLDAGLHDRRRASSPTPRST